MNCEKFKYIHDCIDPLKECYNCIYQGSSECIEKGDIEMKTCSNCMFCLPLGKDEGLCLATPFDPQLACSLSEEVDCGSYLDCNSFFDGIVTARDEYTALLRAFGEGMKYIFPPDNEEDNGDVPF
ncbi:MAG: hypothetical protein IJ666_09065 [Ruminococcus sp.]|nr:hypothetical protein [Ruminococcus sp.]